MSEADAASKVGANAPEAATEVHLEPRLQNRNALVYAAQISLIYLAAPVLYVGFVQAALCKRLETSDTIANLPSTVYLAMAWFPVLVAWLFPQARLLKRSISLGYGVIAAAGGAVMLVLLAQPSASVIVAALVGHAAFAGCANGVICTANWEALGRGVAEGWRGKALGLAFGWGPAFAVFGSLGAQLLLEGKLFGWQPPAWLLLPYPYSYALLYAASMLIMGLAAFIVRFYTIPMPTTEVQRESFATSVLGGFKQFANYRVLLIACVAYLLVYCGNMVQNNMSIFTQEALGRPPEELAGYQLALRFSFKMLAGFLLGWLLTRTNPKLPLLVTVGLQIAGVLWVLLVPGYWFMIAFGINGAGELFGVYYVNYPVACSPKSQMRRNVAFLMLISSVVAVAPVFYGWISDTWSLRTSFWAALVILVFTAVLVAWRLPARPRPRAEDLLAADLVEEVLEEKAAEA